MRITIEQHAGDHERYAADVKLPAPGTTVVFNGHDDGATVVAAERVDDTTLRLTLDVPDPPEELLRAFELPSFGFSVDQ